MKIKLNDGTELNAIMINGSTRYYQNVNRDSLEFLFGKNEYTFETLEAAFSTKDKTKKITLIDEKEEYIKENLHEGYVIRASMSLTPVVISPATPTQQEETEERWSIVMVQETYLEHMVSEVLAGRNGEQE